VTNRKERQRKGTAMVMKAEEKKSLKLEPMLFILHSNE
jgi:hypothetical protein